MNLRSISFASVSESPPRLADSAGSDDFDLKNEDPASEVQNGVNLPSSIREID
jgi:hypothetical protein